MLDGPGYCVADPAPASLPAGAKARIEGAGKCQRTGPEGQAGGLGHRLKRSGKRENARGSQGACRIDAGRRLNAIEPQLHETAASGKVI